MNDQWIPIFRSGAHTSASGENHTYTDADLDIIVSKYDAAQHEAPIVIGHPQDNAPAWGWVKELKREGSLLYAKFKDLVPEFVEMVKKKLFKKRSISLYPDLTLRHVGFLGAMPPAVKGLPDIHFREAAAQTIEFEEETNPAFSTRTKNPEEFIHQKAIEFMEKPIHVDSFGRRSTRLTYAEAVKEVMYQYPEVTETYCETMRNRAIINSAKRAGLIK